MERYCINQDYTIKEAIERIDGAKNRVVIVINANEKVIGVISQGDIIRALLDGKSLFTKVSTIIRPNFIYLDEIDMARAYEIFKNKNITLLPVVDDNFKLSAVISMEDIFRYMEALCKN